MTPEEIELLKAIYEAGEQRFGLRRKTAAAAQAFDELVEALEWFQRYRWVDLDVTRCTEAGREALRLLGE